MTANEIITQEALPMIKKWATNGKIKSVSYNERFHINFKGELDYLDFQKDFSHTLDLLQGKVVIDNNIWNLIIQDICVLNIVFIHLLEGKSYNSDLKELSRLMPNPQIFILYGWQEAQKIKNISDFVIEFLE